MTVIAVTRAGTGKVYRFKSLQMADVHPLLQYGDPVITSADVLRQCLTLPECAAVAAQVGESVLAKEIRDCPVGERPRVSRLMGGLWSALERRAPAPPSDPTLIIREIVQDRVATRSMGVHLRPRGEAEVSKKHHVEQDIDTADVAVVSQTTDEVLPFFSETAETAIYPEEEAAAEAEAAAPAPDADVVKSKTRAIPREAKFAEASVISLCKDVDGKQYSAEHNPKKMGSASAERFAKYRHGMTVKEALDAGLLRGDFSSDMNKGYISIV